MQVVGLHTHNDSQAILQSLRAGAMEFLYAPFDLATQRDAIARLRRLVVPENVQRTEAGHAVAFSSSSRARAPPRSRPKRRFRCTG